MVAERVGQIESAWSSLRLRAPEVALDQAVMRLNLLQSALRRRLLCDDRPQVRLNRYDPVGQGVDFTELDAMAETLWSSTALPVEEGEGLQPPTPSTQLPAFDSLDADLAAAFIFGGGDL